MKAFRNFDWLSASACVVVAVWAWHVIPDAIYLMRHDDHAELQKLRDAVRRGHDLIGMPQ